MTEDHIYKWLLHLGCSSKEASTVQGRMKFLFRHFKVQGCIPSTRKLCKAVLNSLRDKIVRDGYEMDQSTFVTIAITAYESKKKYDIEAIAFARSKGFYRSDKWRNLRLIALAARNFCSACGRNPVDHGVVLHVDHILPRSIYPEHALNISNLQILCEDCNIGKGNTVVKRF